MTRAELNSARWQRTRRAVLNTWIARHGPVCPGWRREPHPATDLTVDHVEPRSTNRGLTVLCRSCNGRKGAWRPKPKPASRAAIHEERR